MLGRLLSFMYCTPIVIAKDNIETLNSNRLQRLSRQQTLQGAPTPVLANAHTHARTRLTDIDTDTDTEIEILYHATKASVLYHAELSILRSYMTHVGSYMPFTVLIPHHKPLQSFPYESLLIRPRYRNCAEDLPCISNPCPTHVSETRKA